ncbi:MAG: hypothetical protein V7776_10955 [Halopseudomonas aestusnigri]
MNNRDIVPEGYHSITPYFILKDADKLVDFLITAFGASLIKENRNDDKRIQHARVLIGTSIIILNESSDTYRVHISNAPLC